MRTKRRNPTAKGRYERGPVLPVLAMVALFTVIFAVSCGASPGDEARQGEQPSDAPAAPENVDNPTLGAADAPVEMVEWGDFQ